MEDLSTLFLIHSKISGLIVPILNNCTESHVIFQSYDVSWSLFCGIFWGVPLQMAAICL